MQPAEAARINGSKSHGPVTAEGKAISSQNSLKHGLCSKQVVLPDEDPSEYEQHRAGYIQTFQPRNQMERDLVHTMAAARWRINRLMALEARLFTDAEDAQDLLKALSKLARYEAQLNRTFDKAFQTLQQSKLGLDSVGKPAVERNEPKPDSEMDDEALMRYLDRITAPPASATKPASGPNSSIKGAAA